MADDPCTIRPMRASDKSAVAAMIVSLAAFHGDVGFTANVAILDCCLGRKKRADVLVALHGKNPVGFSATYDHVNLVSGHKVRHIDLIFVEAEHRRRGIGVALVAAIAKKAASDGFARVSVRARNDNDLANDFYTKLGFSKRTDATSQYTLRDPAGLGARLEIAMGDQAQEGVAGCRRIGLRGVGAAPASAGQDAAGEQCSGDRESSKPFP